MAESLRLFVAIELPGEVREALGRLQHELQRQGLEKLRWVRPESIHLTLKFLGETPAEKVPALQAALGGAASIVPIHEVKLGSVGTFPRGPQGGVLWVGINGDTGTLELLYREVEKALTRRGFPREGRSFRPHLTLARSRPESGVDLGDKRWGKHVGRAEAGPIPVRDLSLMRSTLRPTGAIYERVAAFPLGGA